MTSPVLGIPDVTTQQKKKTDTVNQQRDLIEAATQIFLDLSFDADTTLTAAQFNQNVVFRCTASAPIPTGGVTLYVPVNQRDFKVKNSTGDDLAVRVVGDIGTAVILTDGGGIIGLYSDGTDVETAGGGGGGVSAGNVTVSPPFMGFEGGLSGAFSSTSSAGTFEPLDWNDEVIDTDGFHEGVTNPDRITIPVGLGIRKVRVDASVSWAGNATGVRRVRIRFNDTSTIKTEYAPVSGSLSHPQGVSGAFVSVVDGDYFTVDVQQDSGGALDVDDNTNTWIKVEVIETDEAAFPPESLKAFVTTADKLVVSSTVAMWLADRRISLADNFAGSLGYAISGPNGGAVVFDVDVEGVKIGEISFADTGDGSPQTATFDTTASAVEDVEIGERLEIVAPANIQSMDDVAFTLQAWRS